MALQKIIFLKESQKLTQSEMQNVMGGGTYTQCSDERRVWESKYMIFRYETTTYRYDDQGKFLCSSVELSAPSNLCYNLHSTVMNVFYYGRIFFIKSKVMYRIALSIIFIMLLGSTLAFSQQYSFDENAVNQSFKKFALAYELRKHKIDPLTNKGNYKDALPYVLEAYKYDPYISGTLSHCYMAIGDIDNAYKYAIKSFEVGWHLKYFDQDIFNDKSLWSKIKNHYDSLDKAGEIIHIQTDTILSNKICKMLERDQAIRKSYIAYENSESPNKAVLDSFENQMKYTDALNMEELINHVSQYGYPNEKKIDPICDINTLLLHTNLTNGLYFIPIIKQAALKNNNYWHDLMGVIYHITFRMLCYDKHNQQNKLLFIRNNNAGKVDLDGSFIQIYSMINVLKDNTNISIELFAYNNEDIDFNQSINNLEQIQAAFIQFGIDRKRVKILTDMQTAREGFLDQYKVPYGMFQL